MTRAAEIIAAVAERVAPINDPLQRLATQVGMLQGELRLLCNELDDEQAPAAAPQDDDGPDDYIDDAPIPDRGYADRAAADWAAWRTR
jgi:hypothetical protein